MARLEILLQDRSTFDSLVQASDEKIADDTNGADLAFGSIVADEDMRRRIEEEVPFSQMWREVLGSHAASTDRVGSVADKLFGEAIGSMPGTLLTTAAEALAEHYPDLLMSARIDFEISDDHYTLPHSPLAMKLLDFRMNYELERPPFKGQERVISNDWIAYANLISIKDPDLHDAAYRSANEAISTFIREREEGGPVLDMDTLAPLPWGFPRLMGPIRVVAPVIARHFPQVVVTHLRDQRSTLMGADA